MFPKDRDIPVLTYPGANDLLIIHHSKTFSPNDIIDINFLYVCNQTGFKNFISESLIDFATINYKSDGFSHQIVPTQLILLFLDLFVE